MGGECFKFGYCAPLAVPLSFYGRVGWTQVQLFVGMKLVFLADPLDRVQFKVDVDNDVELVGSCQVVKGSGKSSWGL